MPRSSESILTLAGIAAGQWGLLTTQQARQAGVTYQQLSRLTGEGFLERLRPGVYRLAGTASHIADPVRVAWLAADPTRTVHDRLDDSVVDVVSHRSAALLHRLGDLDADVVEFTSAARRQPRDKYVRLHRGDVPEQDRVILDGLPVTTVLRTISDLASAHLDGGHLAGVLRDALARGEVAPDMLTEVLRPYAHRYGHPIGDAEGLVVTLLRQSGIPGEVLHRLLGPSADQDRSGDSAPGHDHVDETDGQAVADELSVLAVAIGMLAASADPAAQTAAANAATAFASLAARVSGSNPLREARGVGSPPAGDRPNR